MSDRAETREFVTKFAAAQRQLDAAIRMHFSNEDELAIHTIAAAAFRILRDLKEKRGRGQLSEVMNAGVFAYAEDLATEKIHELPEALLCLKGLIDEVAEGIRRGAIKSDADVNLKLDSSIERSHWAKFNLPANFLKHADSDHDELLTESELNNQELLANACAAYKTLLGNWTPEMYAFAQLWNAEANDVPGFVPNEFCMELRELDPRARRFLCLELINRLKAQEAKPPSASAAS